MQDVADMGSNYTKIFYRDYENLQKEYDRVLEKQKTQEAEIRRFQRVYELERREKEKLARQISEQEAEIAALKREVARLNGILNADGSNSGTPTSQTPLRKKKRIPNTREKSGKSRGGQSGHAKV